MKTHVHLQSDGDTKTISVKAPGWVRHLPKQQQRLWHDAVAHGVLHMLNAEPTRQPSAERVVGFTA